VCGESKKWKKKTKLLEGKWLERRTDSGSARSLVPRTIPVP